MVFYNLLCVIYWFHCRFVEYFRLDKTTFNIVLDKIAPSMKSRAKSTCISSKVKLAATLRFFAQGSYQSSVGNDFNLGLAQSTVSTILTETINVLEAVICPLYIKFKLSEDKKLQAKHFLETLDFPVLSAV